MLTRTRSEQLFREALAFIPGGVNSPVRAFRAVGGQPFFANKARGAHVWDVDGNEYVDLWMGHYTHILGHRSEIVMEALERQLEQGIHWGILCEKQVEAVVINMEHAAFDQGLAQALGDRLGGPCYTLHELKAEHLYLAVREELNRQPT